MSKFKKQVQDLMLSEAILDKVAADNNLSEKETQEFKEFAFEKVEKVYMPAAEVIDSVVDTLSGRITIGTVLGIKGALNYLSNYIDKVIDVMLEENANCQAAENIIKDTETFFNERFNKNLNIVNVSELEKQMKEEKENGNS